MSVSKFYELKVKDVRPETMDCVSVTLEVPEELKEIFRFSAGQYLTFRRHIENADVRRSYSICTSPKEGELRVAIKKVEKGKFSTYALSVLKKGDILDVMPPLGKFTPRKNGTKHKQYLAIAAGSGITPVMSIMKSVLEEEPNSDFTLIYGNRSRNTIIFREPIEALKNKYMQRLRVYHIFSREYVEFPLFNGRITAEKCRQLCDTLIDLTTIDEIFICGPEEMMFPVREQLLSLNVPPNHIHIELFSSPDQPRGTHEQWVSEHKNDKGPVSKVSITLDGLTFDMDLAYNGDSILDAALKHGADLPYACKGGGVFHVQSKISRGKGGYGS